MYIFSLSKISELKVKIVLKLQNDCEPDPGRAKLLMKR